MYSWHRCGCVKRYDATMHHEFEISFCQSQASAIVIPQEQILQCRCLFFSLSHLARFLSCDISFQPHLLSPHTIPCFVWALFVVFFVKRKKNKPTEFELFKPLCVSLGFVELSRHLWHRPSLDVDQTRIDSLEGWESCPVSETLTWNNGGFPKQKPWDFF